MPMTASHPELGMLDATLGDLGARTAWAAVHRPSRPVGLLCRGCGGAVHAKVSPRGLRFFSHSRADTSCTFNGETLAHRLLKAELAAGIRAAGWIAELEVAGTGWRADVLAMRPDSGKRIAWEAQLASTTAAELNDRTWTMRQEVASVVWVTDRTAPWLRHVPSVQVRRAEHDPLQVVDGVAQFNPRWCRPFCRLGTVARARGQHHEPCPGHGSWETTTPLPLEDFIRAVSTGRLRERPMIAPDFTERSARASAGTIIWATESDFAAERAQVDAGERHEAWRQEQDALWAQHAANAAALLERQTALLRPAVEWTYRETGTYPHASGRPDPAWAMGVPLTVTHRLRAVICPVAGRITPALALQLQDVVIFVESEREWNRIARVCLPGQRLVKLQPHRT